MDKQENERITCRCPRGHKLRGGTNLIGETVRCPRCSEKFVFGYQVRKDVTDTAVVRILGDGPATPTPPAKREPKLRPCSRCGVAISAAASVCKHCNCYVGILPDFLSKLSDGSSIHTN
ncbi:hypothetical protein [Stieleria mannarensis]|uniref:hypothetical protein n=1 Tax=Stieleria mannarensis TaxID=2755585 RepID=UPI0015FF0E26|nr:hypothetical protein [Rhodopirellula sp. JC639]